MEMEMDKFLAKKSLIFNKIIFQGGLDKLEFQIYKSISHLFMKSLYELVRQSRIVSVKHYL